MARKKAAADRPNEKKSARKTDPVPVSELAAMILGCKEQWGNLPILADWLEERLNLSAMACLLRSPDLQPLAKELYSCEEFDYFALGLDVFIWLAKGHFLMDQVGFDRRPCMVVGLYAHPQDKPGNWAKIVGMITLEEETEADPQRPGDRLVKKHPRVEEARRELATFARPRKER
jgi:hypothetical protein